MVKEGFDLSGLATAVSIHGATVRVVVATTQGSVPREAGTAMLVWNAGQSGTIGGGALEWEATRIARGLIGSQLPWSRQVVRLPLGPALGQCCGGAVTLVLERFASEEIASLTKALAGSAVFTRPTRSGAPLGGDTRAVAHMRRIVRGGRAVPLALTDDLLVESLAERALPLWVYGAGHVGRAIVRAAEGLPIEITWVDTAPDRFPVPAPAHAAAMVAEDPARAVAFAPDDAAHLVLTHSHALDLAICHSVLSRDFRHLGLIGSSSKRARFLGRLRDFGHRDTVLERLNCPIGDKSLGKRPAAIALGVLSDLLRLGTARACPVERQA